MSSAKKKVETSSVQHLGLDKQQLGSCKSLKLSILTYTGCGKLELLWIQNYQNISQQNHLIDYMKTEAENGLALFPMAELNKQYNESKVELGLWPETNHLKN